MSEEAFDQDAWLARIGYTGLRTPTLQTLQGLVAAHSRSIAYESIDVLLDRPPKLDLASLQAKMIAGRCGGLRFSMLASTFAMHLGKSSGKHCKAKAPIAASSRATSA